MPITDGQALTHYQILAPLGAGGMGEVYRARDTRLQREVAIKVLPEHFADDEERLRIEAAIEHYRKVLGFYLEWARYYDSGGIANLWRGSLALHLMTDRSFGPSRIYCHLESRRDVERLHDDLRAAAANVTEAPTDRPWGNYEMAVVDLDDNEFRFAASSDDPCQYAAAAIRDPLGGGGGRSGRHGSQSPGTT